MFLLTVMLPMKYWPPLSSVSASDEGEKLRLPEEPGFAAPQRARSTRYSAHSYSSS